jgi:hypothetical protein
MENVSIIALDLASSRQELLIFEGLRGVIRFAKSLIFLDPIIGRSDRSTNKSREGANADQRGSGQSTTCTVFSLAEAEEVGRSPGC